MNIISKILLGARYRMMVPGFYALCMDLFLESGSKLVAKTLQNITFFVLKHTFSTEMAKIHSKYFNKYANYYI